MELIEVKQKFIELYGDGEVHLFHSPGRVNLIGEHTDYNGGYVFPCALSFGTFGAVRLRKDCIVNLATANTSLQVTFNTNDIVYCKEDDWGNYPKGMIHVLQQKCSANFTGADIFVAGNIPNSAGLSSSASLLVLIGIMFNDLLSLNITMQEIATLAQKAENEFIGLKCGIMDQFAIAMGKKDYAIMLNCMEMKYEYVPVILNGYKIVIANTNKKRGLADSKYNERCEECEQAVTALQKELDIKLLADVSIEIFEKHKHLIENEVVRKRAEHVVYENERVLIAVEKLKSGDIDAFGKLMIDSHNSLRDLYEVTGIELDALVDEALKADGTVGSRMTGAGFGGCTVSVVKDNFVDSFIKTVGTNYTKITGLSAEFYIADVGDGAKRV